MKTHRQALVFTNIIVLVVLSLSLLAAEHLDAQERVRAGYSGISGYQAPLWLGIDLGLFKKYGLTLEPILFRGGAESTHALSGNEIQFDVVSPQPHIAANLSGADIIIIGTYFNKHLQFCCTARHLVAARSARQKSWRPIGGRIEPNRGSCRAQTLGDG
jgi:ABC-type nitrate/sulfonate/bicarbonate transport system substrate-binding protein